MIEPKHISLPWRQALFGRLLAYEAVQVHAPDAEPESASRKIEREMEELGRKAIKSRSLRPLDEWLRQTVRQALANTETSYGCQDSTPAGAILRDLEDRAAKLSCFDCAKGDAICRGGNRDHRIVAEGGHCFTHITELFSIVMNVTKAYYHKFARGYLRPPEIVLSSSEAADIPHNIPVAIFVGAETCYKDKAGAPISLIDLKLAVESLDWESWLAVFYLFLHELICHAYAGTASPRRCRQEMKTYDAFAEGWMNFICDMILADVLNGVPPAVPAAENVQFRARYVEAGQNFSRARRRRKNGTIISTIAQSVRAAEQLFFALQRLLGHAEAREAIYRVSLDLNLLERPIPARTQLVVNLERDLAGPHVPNYGWNIHIINQYLEGRLEAPALFDQLVG